MCSSISGLHLLDAGGKPSSSVWQPQLSPGMANVPQRGVGERPLVEKHESSTIPVRVRAKGIVMHECYFYSSRCKTFRSFWHLSDRPLVSRFSPGWIFQGLKERKEGNSLATVWLGDMRPHVALTVGPTLDIPSKFFLRQNIYMSFGCLHNVASFGQFCPLQVRIMSL